MRDGISVSVSINSPTYAGETLPTWVGDVKGPSKVIDASAVMVTSASGGKSYRIAVINRSYDTAYEVPIRIAFASSVDGEGAKKVEVEARELYHPEVTAKNTFEKEDEVKLETTRKEGWEGKWRFREHSFTLLVIDEV
jgi:alpha-N-arabinofuranosidase